MAKEESFHYMPIIMLTANTSAEQVREARDAGVTEYLAKPVSPKSIYERICSIVDHPRTFIHSNKYDGPDRRRHNETATDCPGRRQGDKKNDDDQNAWEKSQCEQRVPNRDHRERVTHAVLVSFEEYESEQETLKLLSSPKNAERLLASIQQAEKGKLQERILPDENSLD